jgi:hypothetical protein
MSVLSRLRSLAQSACEPSGFEGGLPFYYSRPPLWCVPVPYGPDAWCSLLSITPRGWLALIGRSYPRSFFARFDN